MNLQNILLEKVFKGKASNYEICTLQVFEAYSWDFDNLEANLLIYQLILKGGYVFMCRGGIINNNNRY